MPSTMPRKWIATRIAGLDAERDYDEIWKLMSAYRPNDFFMNLVYAITFPHFFVREHDARPLFDHGKGKILTRPDRRSDDTSWKMQVWWHYGSSHEQTRKNVESINRLHEHYAKQFPGSFKYHASYMYTLCYECAGMHRLFLRIGLPGYTEHEQRAAVNYWSRMSGLFRNAATGEQIDGFPDDFDGVMAYMDRFELEGMAEPSHEMGRAGANAILSQFEQRYFPRWLHGVVRAWIISLYPPNLPHAYELKVPPRPIVKLFRLGTAALFAFGEKFAPDPTDTFEERRAARLARERGGAPPPPLEPPEHEAARLGGCPHFQRTNEK
ncbi:MAG: oxygenase MpaB family protein [Pseudomonadota bacterium]